MCLEKKKRKILIIIFPLVFFVSLISCGKKSSLYCFWENELKSWSCTSEEEDLKNKKFNICDEDWNYNDIINHINESYAFVSTYTRESQSNADLIREIVINFLLFGIDFTKLSNYQILFEDKIYSLVNKETKHSISFKLYFASDFESFKKDDLIPFNVFSHLSYVTDFKIEENIKDVTENIAHSVSVGSSLSSVKNAVNEIKKNYSFKKGPLFSLLKAEIKTEGSLKDLGKNKPNEFVQLKHNLISFELNSQSTFEDAFHKDDTGFITINMTSVKTNMNEIDQAINNQKFGFSYDGSNFERPAKKTVQKFYDTIILIKQDDIGSYLEGFWKSELRKNDKTSYIKGDLSQRRVHDILYYCDKDFKNLIGTLKKDNPQDPLDPFWNLIIPEQAIVPFVLN